MPGAMRAALLRVKEAQQQLANPSTDRGSLATDQHTQGIANNSRKQREPFARALGQEGVHQEMILSDARSRPFIVA